jgi:hypothetical protein
MVREQRRRRRSLLASTCVVVASNTGSTTSTTVAFVHPPPRTPPAIAVADAMYRVTPARRDANVANVAFGRWDGSPSHHEDGRRRSIRHHRGFISDGGSIRHPMRRNTRPSSSLLASSSSTSTTWKSARRLRPGGVDFTSLSVMDVVLFRRRTSGGDENDEYDDEMSSSGGRGGMGGSKGGRKEARLEIGAVQENGTIAPLSAWTHESAYVSNTNDMLAFVVDENHQFPGLTSDDVCILDVPSSSSSSLVGYGSRQVGGGKGPGNPHGEESELIYYVDRAVVEREYRVSKTTDSRTTTMMEEGECESGGARDDDDDGGDDDDDDTVDVLLIDIVVNSDLEHLW